MKNLPKKVNKTEIREFFRPLECKSLRLPKRNGIGFVGFLLASERKRALAKDKSFISKDILLILMLRQNTIVCKIISVNQNYSNDTLLNNSKCTNIWQFSQEACFNCQP